MPNLLYNVLEIAFKICKQVDADVLTEVGTVPFDLNLQLGFKQVPYSYYY